MSIPRPSYEEIRKRIYNRVVANTGLNAPLDSSIFGMIINAAAAEWDLIWQQVEEISDNANLSTAVGSALDQWGLIIGVPRKQARESTTSGSSRSIRFTNLSPGTVNIPQGTRVFKSSEPQIAYFTSEGVVINSSNSAEVHVKAADTGELFNVAIGELNAHNYPNTQVFVTNILPINNGSQVESDASYRERLLQEYRRRDSLTVSNTIALLRSVAGVRDVFLLNHKRGPGTFDVVIIPWNYSDTSIIVSECQGLLDSAVPVGISAIVMPPQYRQLDITVNLKFSPKEVERRDSIRSSVRAQIIARIDNIPVEQGNGEGTFNASQIRAMIINSDPLVLDAIVKMGIDSSWIASEGDYPVGVGERIILRSLSVE